MTKLADDFEQWFRLRVLMFGAAIELQIVETAVVTGLGQQFVVRADFFHVAAVHHHDLSGRQNGGKPMGDRDHVFTVFNWGQSRLALIWGDGGLRSNPGPHEDTAKQTASA